MSIPLPSTAVTLRALLLLGGGAMIAGSRLARRVPSFWEDPLPLLALAAGVLALALALVPRLAERWRALGALVAVIPGYWLLFRLHSFETFPQVDWLRPHTIDRGAWLPMAAVLVGLAAVRGVRARRARLRLLAGAGLLLGLIMAGAYQLSSQHFNQERIEPPAGLLYRSPVVQQGQLGQCFWSRQVIQGKPIAIMGSLVASERNVADLAHGIHLERAEKARAASGDPDQGRLQDRVRAALWAAQKAGSAAMLALQASVMLLLAPLALLMLLDVRPGRWVERLALGWLLLPCLGVALVNLLFHGVMAAAMLPDPARGRWGSIGLALGLALLCGLIERAGHTLFRSEARSP